VWDIALSWDASLLLEEEERLKVQQYLGLRASGTLYFPNFNNDLAFWKPNFSFVL